MTYHILDDDFRMIKRVKANSLREARDRAALAIEKDPKTLTVKGWKYLIDFRTKEILILSPKVLLEKCR